MADEGDEAKALADAFAETSLERHRRRTAPLRFRRLAGPVICVGCGDNVPLERLAVVPDTNRCIACQVMRDARSL